MTAIDISVDGLSKSYRDCRSGDGRRILDFRPKSRFWALRQVSFDLFRGEALGVIGPNGSGKTTLIKLLSRITAPDKGTIRIAGRLMSLVEVGAGFHPELTGRDNVYLNAAIFGTSASEVRKRFDSIVEFSGLADFIDAPVKNYSSGMFVRLGFAVASHLDADILLLDEVLAVGDIAFQARCMDRIEQIRRAGRTILLVSHDLAAVERLCDRAILLTSGQIVDEGPPRGVIESFQIKSAAPDLSHGSDASDSIIVGGVTFVGPNGSAPRTGDPLTCQLSYEARSPLEQVIFTVRFVWPSGYTCNELVSSPITLGIGPGNVTFDCPVLTMQRGLYTVDIRVATAAGFILATRMRVAPFRVDPGLIVQGDFYMPHSSTFKSAWDSDASAHILANSPDQCL